MPDAGAPGAGTAGTLVGVLGGVGPLATVRFMERVVRLTDAARDQDHVDMVVLQHAAVPDRTAFVLGRSTDDPGPVLAADARRLAAAGAGFLVLPCNTAHAFAGAIAAATPVPLLSAVDVTVSAVLSRGTWTGGRDTTRPGAVGLLATEGTIESGVYRGAFGARGVATLVPDAAGQATVTSLVYDGVKAGRGGDLSGLESVVADLRSRGAGAIVLGCTELSVAAEATPPDLLPDVVLVDALDELARATVPRAGRRLRASTRTR
ncbi:aspartate/glutamate racemase family protein [Myceligenerans pegani]|uniref:Amino acid racemase n=1 Tax=Myceligenerans pegani TaxID=2776917 RepID=A0ABR9N469_9MICO|nr:amino acid racemase [Myceligenerans sp. TRM 65318]MBE1878459.1 amino acid racemase [Myceligenerans sp. TRM 65318]MBE3020730.1 amino acid racemase [Myceligenerans sp. TRM 65318]